MAAYSENGDSKEVHYLDSDAGSDVAVRRDWTPEEERRAKRKSVAL